MYVWSDHLRFLAVAQAHNVEEARAVLLEEIGTSNDGSCPEREAADNFVRAGVEEQWARALYRSVRAHDVAGLF